MRLIFEFCSSEENPLPSWVALFFYKLFDMIKENQLEIKPPTIFKLSEGREAHRFMESRQRMGKVILVP